MRLLQESKSLFKKKKKRKEELKSTNLVKIKYFRRIGTGESFKINDYNYQHK